jgi:NDP-sugar pyrophosphorylase family protein
MELKTNIQLIIPMSGIGKRFIEAGYSNPKPLIEMDGKPIIQHVVELFPGVTDITFICNEKHLKETNMREILMNISPNCRIHQVPNENRLGPVDAVKQIFDHIDDDKEVIISYCDYGTYWNFDIFLKETRDGNFDGVIPCYIGFHPHMLGSDNYAFCKEKDMTLLEIKEKEPFTDNKMNEYASNGTYYFNSGKLVKKYFQELIDLDINLKGEYYVSLVYNLLVRDGLRVNIFEIDKMLQWGTPYDLEIYKGWSKYFSNLMIEQPKISNPPNTTLILPMAGKGSRFVEEGYELPKPLIDVDGKPMIIRAVDCLPQSDKNYFICLQDHIKNFNVDSLLSSTYKNCNVLEIKDTTEGQACTCELGIKAFDVKLKDPILISACDNGVYYDTNKYLEMVNDESIDIIVWTFRNNQASKTNPNAYAWLDVDDDGFIKHVSCKKFIYDDPLKTHAIIGTMFFRKGQYFMDGLKANYDENIRTNGEFYVDDVLNQNIKSGLKVKVFEVKNYICWGTPNDYRTYTYWRDYFNKIYLNKK